MRRGARSRTGGRASPGVMERNETIGRTVSGNQPKHCCANMCGKEGSQPKVARDVGEQVRRAQPHQRERRLLAVRVRGEGEPGMSRS